MIIAAILVSCYSFALAVVAVALVVNLVGAAIIVAAAVPLVLLLLPRRPHVDWKEASSVVSTLPS